MERTALPVMSLTLMDTNPEMTTGPHRNRGDCSHSPLHGDQSVTKTKYEIVSLWLKTEDKDRGAVSSVVAEVILNPSQPGE